MGEELLRKVSLVLTGEDIVEMIMQCFELKDEKERALCIYKVGWILVKASKNAMEEKHG